MYIFTFLILHTSKNTFFIRFIFFIALHLCIAFATGLVAQSKCCSSIMFNPKLH